MRGIDLDKVNTVTYAELRRLLARSGFRHSRFVLPEIDPRALAGPLRTLGHVYNGLRRTVPGAAVLHQIGPFLEVVAHKGPQELTSTRPVD